MARLSLTKRKIMRKSNVRAIIVIIMRLVVWFFNVICSVVDWHYKSRMLKARPVNRFCERIKHLKQLVYESDVNYMDELRINRRMFVKLCQMLHTIGRLEETKNMNINEQVAMFLHIIAHHSMNQVIKGRFMRSGETISRHFHHVLHAVIWLQGELLKSPQPVPANSTDEKWKWFKNCIGALDGTYIRVHVPEEDKPRYRTRKNEIATNVLGVCSQDMQFIYALPVYQCIVFGFAYWNSWLLEDG